MQPVDCLSVVEPTVCAGASQSQLYKHDLCLALMYMESCLHNGHLTEIHKMRNLSTGSPTGTVTQSCQLMPGDICRHRQQAYPANESSALRQTKEIAYHQTVLKKSLIIKENLLKI